MSLKSIGEELRKEIEELEKVKDSEDYDNLMEFSKMNLKEPELTKIQKKVDNLEQWDSKLDDCWADISEIIDIRLLIAVRKAKQQTFLETLNEVEKLIKNTIKESEKATKEAKKQAVNKTFWDDSLTGAKSFADILEDEISSAKKIMEEKNESRNEV